jgi:syntaxin-binding protein 5
MIYFFIDDKDNVSIFDLSRNDPQVRARASSSANPFTPSQTTTSGAGPSCAAHPDTPMRIAAHTARNGVICVEVSPLHDHLFLGLRDGTIDAFDLSRLCPSPYRIPNLWWEEEEILRRSGVPDAPNRRHVPLIIDIKTHPKDMNQLLCAYEGGVLLLNAKEKSVIQTYQLRHLPGAMGAAVGDPDAMWTERASPATCIAWRPDGLVFACGHEDGCISFWDLQDDSKPVMVRTLEFIDVDKPVGVPDEVKGGLAQTREPIFKLAWSGFPEQSWLEMAANATSKVQQQQYQQSHLAQQELTSGSVLTILGGATERHPPGLVCLHLPPFAYPYSSYWSSKTPDAIAKSRQALRLSLDTTTETRYSTRSTVEDFILIPKNNPYYDLAYDPVAMLILEAPNARLPPLAPPASARGLTAYAFPPPIKSSILPPLPGQQATFAQQKLNLPLPLSTTGPGAVLGAKWTEVPVLAYRKLAGMRDVMGLPKGLSNGSGIAMEDPALHTAEEDLLLRGGLASPTIAGNIGGAHKEEVVNTMARAGNMRILITWHLDGTVRFHDASLQLLLVGVNKGAASEPTDYGPKKPKYLEKAFPSPLPHLTIDVWQLLKSPSMIGHPIFDRLKADRRRLRIVKIDFAPEALELVIVLQSGQVLHYKFGYAHYSQTEEVKEAVAEEVQHDEEMAAEMAGQQWSPTTHHIDHRNSLSKLDGAMAGAMKELSTSSPHGTSSPVGSPPPRPKRDPKRGAIARKIGLSRDGEAELSSPPARQSRLPVQNHSYAVEEITSIGHLATWDTDNFKPNILVELQRGEVTSVSLSDVGFLAIACGLSLAVIDLRGPELIIREGFADGVQEHSRAGRREQREEKKIIDEESKSPIQQVKFSICRTMEQQILSPTLIIGRSNGFTTVWTFTKTSLDNTWICERSHGSMMEEMTKAVRVEVLDMAGNLCPAVPSELQRSMREQGRGPSDWQQQGGATDPSDVNIFFAAGPHTLSLRAGLTGPRLAAAQVEEVIQDACIVDRRGEKICLALSNTSMRIYSLPSLNLITRIPRHNRNREERLSTSNVSLTFDGSGDFIEVVNSIDIRMWTIFATLPRPGMPSLLLYQPVALPSAPGMLNNMASSVVNWIGGKSTALTTTAQFDEAIAGNKRPPVPKLPEQRYIEVRVEQQFAKDRAANSHQDPAAATSATSGWLTSSDSKKVERKQTVQETQDATSQASWNIDLAKQRGEMITSLEEGLSSLEKGAKGWMKSTREDMIKNAAKDRLGKMFF